MLTRSEDSRAVRRAGPPPESPIAEPVWLLREPEEPEGPVVERAAPDTPVFDRLGALLVAAPVFFYAFRVLER